MRVSLVAYAGFQSTPSSRRATPTIYDDSLSFYISIHALLTEGDPGNRTGIPLHTNFNPRPPHGGRHGDINNAIKTVEFQSTPSSRRATQARAKVTLTYNDFNPRPPHGGRPHQNSRRKTALLFQSTPSSRRATPDAATTQGETIISIHALLTEGDLMCLSTTYLVVTFQSTPSSRRATSTRRVMCIAMEFQSTPSSRRATGVLGKAVEVNLISIHALLTEGDSENDKFIFL